MILDFLFIFYMFIGFLYFIYYVTIYICEDKIFAMIMFMMMWPLIFIVRIFFDFGKKPTIYEPVVPADCDYYDNDEKYKKY